MPAVADATGAAGAASAAGSVAAVVAEAADEAAGSRLISARWQSHQFLCSCGVLPARNQRVFFRAPNSAGMRPQDWRGWPLGWLLRPRHATFWLAHFERCVNSQ